MKTLSYIIIVAFFTSIIGFQLPVTAKTLAQSLLALNDTVVPALEKPRVKQRIINDLEDNNKKQKTMRLQLIEITDRQGRKYIGADVPKAELVEYLAQMKSLLASDYGKYRDNQSKRDHGVFHLTVVNPIEYQLLKNKQLKLASYINVTLQGLGSVSSKKTINNSPKTAYYVIANSSEGQFYRQKLLLKAKDFHVTLGFSPMDVHDKSKGIETLILR